jgi:hypothetical protein
MLRAQSQGAPLALVNRRHSRDELDVAQEVSTHR